MPSSPPPSPQAELITAANHGALLAAVRACINQKVIAAYKNRSVGTLLQVEGVLRDSGQGVFTIIVSDDSKIHVTAVAQFSEYSLTGFSPPDSCRSVPAIFIR